MVVEAKTEIKKNKYRPTKFWYVNSDECTAETFKIFVTF